MLPFRKQTKITEMKELGQKPIFIGDGVNDAQAISEAYIGIAIDTKNILTCNSADVVILGNSLNSLL